MTNLNNLNFGAVLTYDDETTVLQKGRCGYPKTTNLTRAKQTDYVLVAYNKKGNANPSKTLEHNEGFLLIKPTDVTQHTFIEDEKEVKRISFSFQQYAKISIDNAWRKLTGGIQSITYYDTKECTIQDAFKKLDLDFDSLVWETLPPKNEPRDEPKENSVQDNTEQSKTIQETMQAEILPLPVAVARAKALIAQHTGIDERAIHISFDQF